MKPVIHDLDIYQGADFSASFQRVSADGDAIIPSDVNIEIRSEPNGVLWCTADTEITSEGIIYMRIPAEVTNGENWATRRKGAWDILVMNDGVRERWVMGSVTVHGKVTENV